MKDINDIKTLLKVKSRAQYKKLDINEKPNK